MTLPTSRIWFGLLLAIVAAACAAPMEPAAEDSVSATGTDPTSEPQESSSGDDESATDTTSTTLQPTSETTRADDETVESSKDDEADLPEPVPATVDEVPAEYLQAVLDDASIESEIAVADLIVVRAQFVEWSDGSLGCPEPGKSYTQAITPGYWVQIEAGSDVLDYRLTDDGAFRRCTETSAPHSGSDGVGGEGTPPPPPDQ